VAERIRCSVRRLPQRGILPDGFCKEIAIGYSASCSLDVLELAFELRDEPDVSAAKARLAAAATAIPALRKLNGWAPGFGDCYPSRPAVDYTPRRIAEWLGLGWINAVRDGRSQPEPPFLSYPPPGSPLYNGYYVMRSGWDLDARCLACAGAGTAPRSARDSGA